MKRLLRHYILFLLASFMLTSNIIYGQTRLENIELNTQKSIRKLISKISSNGNKDTILVNNLHQLSKSVTTLFQKISNDVTIGQPSDSMFINSLEQSQQALEKLINGWTSNEHSTNIIKAIKLDYDIKTNSSPLAASTMVIKIVEVSVLTKSGNQNVAGYDVFYTYMWDSDTKKMKDNFNNQTNNATKNLSPGYYFFWIERNGVIIKSKPKVEIGNKMLPKEHLIFIL